MALTWAVKPVICGLGLRISRAGIKPLWTSSWRKTRQAEEQKARHRRLVGLFGIHACPKSFSVEGVSAYGRWQYGPGFWPLRQAYHPPVPNEYYDPNCGPPRMV